MHSVFNILQRIENQNVIYLAGL